MSFSQELQDFATGFKAAYHHPTEADRRRAEEAGAEGSGRGFAAAQAASGRTPNLSTNWVAGDTPGGAATTPGGTPSAVPTGDGDTATYNPEGNVPTFARTAGTQSAMDDLEAAKRAIKGNESGGRYNALGPVTKNGDRAYGAYQMMGRNIPEWTRAALGKAMTPQEFLANPEAQEKTFEHRFGGYMAKYGPDGAAAAWFSGSPNWRGSTKSDVLGTTVPKYVQNFRAQFNRYRGSRYAAAGVGNSFSGSSDPSFTPDDTSDVTSDTASFTPDGTAPNLTDVFTAQRRRYENSPYASANLRRRAYAAGGVVDDEEMGRPAALPLQASPHAWGAGGRPVNDPTWGGQAPNWQGNLPPMALPTQANPWADNLWRLRRPVQFAAEGGVIDDPAAAGNAEGRQLLDQGMADQSITDPSGIADVIDDGISYMGKVFGFQPSAVDNGTPQNPDGARAFAMNVGAAKPEEMQQIARTVDPQGQMNPAMRQIAMYKGIYNYWMEHNQPEKAQRAVFAMTMAAKEAAHVYGTVALAAAQRGDTKIAADAIAKAYDQVPDGQSISVTDVSPQGARFEMHDLNGNVTQKGQIAMDEMIRVATGMVDGSEWLKSMGTLRTRTDKAGARAEADRAALENFNRLREGGEGDKEFISTLTPQEREAFYKLSPQVQRQLRSEFFKRTEAERQSGKFNVMQDYREREAARKQGNFETRMNTQTDQFEIRRQDGLNKWIVAGDERLEKRAHDDRIREFETARKQNNWEQMRNQTMSNAEKALALKERDLSDRNARFDESQASRRQRYDEIDRRILEQRTQRTAERAAALAERQARQPKMTADERRQAAVDTTANTALTQARANVPEMTGFDQPARQAAFTEAEGTIGANRTYEAQEAARKGQPAIGDMEKLRANVTDTLAARNIKLSPQKQNALVTVASHIARANTDIDEPTAAAIATAAGGVNTPIQFAPDPANPLRVRVKVGDNQPVVMGSDALSMIAMVRGGALRAPQGVQPLDPMAARIGAPTVPNPVAQRVTPGPTAEQAQPGAPPTPTGSAVPVGGVSHMNPVQDAELKARVLRAQRENDKTRARRGQARRALDLGERSIPIHGLYP